MTAKYRRKVVRMLASQNGLCGICGKPAKPKECNLDHITPKSKGGSNRLENLQAAHRECNTLKGDGTWKSSVRLEHRTDLKFSTAEIIRKQRGGVTQ